MVVLGYESWAEAAVGVVKEVLPHLPPMVARCARHEHDVRRAEDTARQLEQQLAAARARVEESAAEAKRLGESDDDSIQQVVPLCGMLMLLMLPRPWQARTGWARRRRCRS